MTSAEIFTKTAALELERIAQKIAYTVPSLDDYEPEIQLAKLCLEEIAFYVKEQRKEAAIELHKSL
jgi:hypothetical protein